MVEGVKRLLIGPPLKTREDRRVKIGILRGMAIMTPDALSSVAYATDQMESVLAVLIAAGAAHAYVSAVLGYSMLGTAVIAVLAFLLFFAYQNIIRHYPQGGGAYAIGLNDLGKYWGLSAASTLVVGYMLTVAVSVAAGVDAVGPVIPFVGHHKLIFNILLTLFIMLMNLRGTAESANAFVPFTYLFIACIAALGVGAIVRGFVHPSQIVIPTAAALHAVQGMSLYLFLKMFANGCSALTGIEAVSNSVPVFKEPSALRARRLLLVLVATLSVLFFIVSGIATTHGLQYNPDVPLINQEAMVIFGTTGIGYAVTVVISLSTMCILAIAANTAFTGCPALWSSMAKDSYMPRWMLHRGYRLVYSNGILFLTVISLGLTIAFDANVSRLIPLYAVCVFYTFTISQLGMVVRRFRERGQNWIISSVGSLFGLLMTAAACGVFLVTHFIDGAWIVLLAVPLMVLGFNQIRKHYMVVREELRYDFAQPFQAEQKGITIVPIASINKASVEALRYAANNFKNVIAVNVISGDTEPEILRATGEDRTRLEPSAVRHPAGDDPFTIPRARAAHPALCGIRTGHV